MKTTVWTAAKLAATALALGLALTSCTASSGDEETPSAAAPSTTSQAPSQTPEPVVTPGAGAECPGIRCTTVMLAGDLLVHPQLWDQAAADARAGGKQPLDFEPLLEGMRAYVAGSDLAVCHMETPVAEADGPYAGYPMFNVPPQILTAAAAVGYQACTTASNHTIDAGTEGLNRTLSVLDSLGLEHTGSYASEEDSQVPLIMDTSGARIGIVEATYGLNGLVAEYPWQVDMLDAEDMIQRAKAAREQGADLVIGAIHAGDEYASAPNSQQMETAHALADSGEFDLIYGHHTHSVLPIENYNGTWIIYGLGNAVTELSPWYAVNNEGLIVRAQFVQEDDGADWRVSDLAWAPSVIVRDPYRWCSVAADLPQGPCASEGQQAEVRQRTVSVVESMGAGEDGAREWLVSEDVAKR
ncbi:CapA family protein [Arthrobacter caoxuetaonis]|uniref:CapA family protein n=1 Tax=Arthrobacter caoxuetaonis TaxID=2886935 RepID=A0A9X1MFP4_9MICC|nr:CapA family protein [Arthrobacter caoxuetaonis]MCC3282661.1 CapA family protein [Arthrobacter caoxuetaonis]MCC3297799.1 CapA family protein [Arthrobacter caoxuetaonis]USQ56007.1 CapA family protein [Arthrobacter caoxuetaonis]